MKTMTEKRAFKRSIRVIERHERRKGIGFKGFGKEFWAILQRSSCKKYGERSVEESRQSISTFRKMK